MKKIYRLLLKLYRRIADLQKRRRLQGLEFAFKDLHGLEVGGPSSVFEAGNLIPVYQWAARVDNVNFATQTTWQSGLEPGATFRFHPGKPPGQQYICEGGDLSSIPTPAFDFILSSHTLEHLANPLKAVMAYKDKLKEGGRLLTLLPHKEGTFDHRRPVTTLAHLREDLEKNTDETDLSHLPEILELHDLTLDPAAGNLEAFKARSLQNFQNRCLHQHVFNTELALSVYDFIGFQIEDVQVAAPFHIIVLGRKLPSQHRPDNRTWMADDAPWRKRSPFHLDRYPQDHLDQAHAQAVLPTAQNTCAVMITFHPDADVPENIRKILPQVARLIVVDNGSSTAEKEPIKDLAAANAHMELIELPDNFGIGVALNRGLERVLEHGFAWALTFDQDSQADPDLFEHLAHLVRFHPVPSKVKMMGAKFIVAETDAIAFGLCNSLFGHNPVVAVITSGALMAMDAYREIGPFREDFFIDMVDLDYCMRLRGKGYQVAISTRPLMRHSCGKHSIHRRFGLTFATSNHTPLRKYYITRNRLIMERRFLFQEPAWVINDVWLALNDLVKIVCFEERRRDKLRSILLGIRHAVTGHMGKADEQRYPFLAPSPTPAITPGEHAGRPQ